MTLERIAADDWFFSNETPAVDAFFSKGTDADCEKRSQVLCDSAVPNLLLSRCGHQHLLILYQILFLVLMQQVRAHAGSAVNLKPSESTLSQANQFVQEPAGSDRQSIKAIYCYKLDPARLGSSRPALWQQQTVTVISKAPEQQQSSLLPGGTSACCVL